MNSAFVLIVITLNLRSILNKQDRLEELILLHHPHILLLQELWLTSVIDIPCLREFDLTFQLDETEPHRGLLTAISKLLPIVRTERVCSHRGSLLILSCIGTSGLRDILLTNYHGNSREDEGEQLYRISAVALQYPNHISFHSGDYNCRLCAASKAILRLGQWLPERQVDEVCNFFRQTRTMIGGYTTDPTSRSDWTGKAMSSILDLIAISNIVPRFNVKTAALSDFVCADHVPVALYVTLDHCWLRKIPSGQVPLTPSLIFDHKYDIRLGMLQSLIDESLPPDQLNNCIHDHIEAGVLAGLNRPLRLYAQRRHNHHQTFGWPLHLLKLVNSTKRKLSCLQRRVIKSGTPPTFEQRQYHSELTAQFNRLRREANSAARSQLEYDLNSLSYSDVRTFFRRLSKYQAVPKRTFVQMDHQFYRVDGSIATGSEASQILAQRLQANVSIDPDFHGTIMLEHLTNILSQPCDEETTSDILAPIAFDELHHAIIHLPNYKAAGPDAVVNELLKISPLEIRLAILALFNQVFISGTIPSDWRSSTTVAIPKKGDLLDSSNWRGISLLPALYKLYTKIHLDRLTTFLKLHSPIHWAQSGYRAGRGTVEQASLIWEVCERRRAAFQHTYLCFADFSMAFDKVHPLALRAALKLHRVPSRYIDLLCDLYANQTATLRSNIDGSESASYHPECGVKQGCRFGPTLFIVVTNILSRYFEEQYAKDASLGVHIPGMLWSRLLHGLYADDLVMFGHDQASLQCMIMHCATWSRNWGFKLSVSKTQCMWIRHVRSSRVSPHFQLYGAQLQTVPVFKYLGIEINDQLDRTLLSRSRLQVFMAAHNNLVTLWSANIWTVKARLQAYIFLVQSVLSYGSGLWLADYGSFSAIGKIIAGHLRRVLSLPKAPSLSIACMELGFRHPFLSFKSTQGKWLAHLHAQPTLLGQLLRTASTSPKTLLGSVLQSFTKLGYSKPSSFDSPVLLEQFMTKLIETERLSVKRVDLYLVSLRGVRYNDPANLLLTHLRTPTLHFARSILLQLRMGCWFTSADLARMHCRRNQLAPPSDPTCLLCSREKETLEHLLCCCQPLQAVRDIHLPYIISRINTVPSWSFLTPEQQAVILIGGAPRGISVLIAVESQLLPYILRFLHDLACLRSLLLSNLGYTPSAKLPSGSAAAFHLV